MSRRRDGELGMRRRITRRDFLNGAAVTLSVALGRGRATAATGGGPEAPASGADTADSYPPALTGLRGSHPGSFEVAHRLRDGTFWEQAGAVEDTGEDVDLVVVGGGISGLAAAHYFRKNGGGRVLILENHDDFGGHARRNEVLVGDRTVLGYGGTFSIQSPAPYSRAARELVEELGIDVEGFRKHVDYAPYRSRGLAHRVFLDRETFGSDRLLVNPAPLSSMESLDVWQDSGDAWKEFEAALPFPEAARRDMRRLSFEPRDYLSGKSSDEKKAALARMSYQRFLKELVGVGEEVIRYYQATTHPLFGVGIDAVAAQDAWGIGLPGFDGLKLDPRPGRGMYQDAIKNEEADRYFFHFPDGNASIARLLVRRLVPGAVPGSSATDVVSARTRYDKLDEPSSPVRLRLSSTVVRVRHLGEPAKAERVEVTYVQGGRLSRVRAKHCILACWHAVIPHLCPELPEAQRRALSSAAKLPLLYTNVVLRNWTAFAKLKTCSTYAPGSYHTFLNLDWPVTLGDYRSAREPEEPIVVHLSKSPCHPGLPARDQHRMGRIELFNTTFETMERNIRDQLARTLSGGGFDPARDIAAIIVNRWPHGYAYEYNSLWDPFWLEGGPLPCETARRPFGRIAIANSDAAAYSYTDAAIEQAHRAVLEITGPRSNR